MGLKPGPQYKIILGKLLDARIDGMVTTEAEERVFLRKWLVGGRKSYVGTLRNSMAQRRSKDRSGLSG